MMNDVSWITHPASRYSEDKMYRFRKVFGVWDGTDSAKIDISADARYKCYLNGTLIGEGPCKGSGVKKYYDTVDIMPYLVYGENVLEVIVLQMAAPDSSYQGKLIQGVLRSGNLCLAASVERYRGREIVSRIVTDAKEGWEVAEIRHIKMKGVNDAVFSETHYADQAGNEEFVPAKNLGGVDSDDKDYYPWGGFGKMFLYPRPIPMMYHKPVELKRDGDMLECEYLTFGIPTFTFEGEGEARILYAECYGRDRTKGDRTDKSLGLYGYEDVVVGNGDTYVFEPFWFRCFRYIRITTTGNMTLKDVKFTEMSYPFVFRDDYDFGTERDNKLWEISARTLMRCTHESYEDCPYYEQLQYGMDTSLQMLFNYQFTDDDLLARKAMDDFRNSQRTDGIMLSRYPGIYDQYIPTFSFFFIFMVHSHYRRFGDKALVRENLRAVDGVLEWFEHFKDEKTGLVKRSKYWNFIDWSEPWDHQWVGGIPFTSDNGIITIHSAMMCYSLRIGAELFDACGRHSTAEEYRARAAALADRINALCYDEEKGMYADDISHTYYSQHMQTWCVLAGIATGDRARRIMENSIDIDAKSTFAFAYFYFRALERVGMYDHTDKLMDRYRNLIDLNCTTIPETPVGARSDCHAWGAVALYEFSAVILGVRTMNVENRSVVVKPYVKNRAYAKGTVSSIAGNVSVDWRKENGMFSITVSTESPAAIRVILPDGTICETDGTGETFTCSIEE